MRHIPRQAIFIRYTLATPPLLLAGQGRNVCVYALCPAPVTPLLLSIGRSHIWSTGQDQCAVIKRQLQLLLPGIMRVTID